MKVIIYYLQFQKYLKRQGLIEIDGYCLHTIFNFH